MVDVTIQKITAHKMSRTRKEGYLIRVYGVAGELVGGIGDTDDKVVYLEYN